MALDATLRPPISPIQPGAYSAVDASALQSQGDPQIPIVAILGAAAGGPPNVPLLYRDIQGLKNRLRSGAAFDCARFVLGAGAGLVVVQRIGTGILQGTKSLAGATGNPVVLTALDYGVWTNSIQVTVAANNNITISFTDANGLTFNENFNLGATATAQNVVDAINGKLAGYAPSQYVSAATAAGTMPLSTAVQAGLTAGSDGSALAAGDWTTGLLNIEPEQVDLVLVATGDATVHAQALTHCQNMSSSAARKERTTVVGAVLAESVSQQITRIGSLRDKRVQLIYPGCVDYSAAGVLTTWDPFYSAAKVAGMHAALPDPATSLTHAPFPAVDLEQQSGKYLSTLQGSDVDQLLRAGVTPITPQPQGNQFWIVDSLSGWNIDDSFRDFHKTRTADLVSIRLRNGLESVFVGKKALDATQDNITTQATQILTDLKNQTILRAFKPAIVTQGQDARTWNVTAPVMLPETNKYLNITVALQPSSLVAREVPASPDALL